MERYSRFVVRHRVAIVVIALSVTAFFLFQLFALRLEIRRRANVPDDHPYVVIQNRMSDLFGGEAVVIIGVMTDTGNIYTPDVLAKIYRITEGVLGLPHVIDTSVFSIAATNARAIVSDDEGTMDIHPLMDGADVSSADVERIRREVREDRFFRGNLVSADETAAVIVADFEAGIGDEELAARVEEIIAPERGEGVRVAVAGSPILRAALARYTSMIAYLFPLAVIVIGLIHWEAFRTFQAMVLPLVTALMSVVWSLGLMASLRLPMDTWSAMTPVLILAVAAGHAVQILKRYYEEFAVVADNDEAIVRAMTAVGPVTLTAGAVAAAGFSSLGTFGVLSVRVFGMLLACGILSALAIEMTFTPACRSLLPAPRERETLRERDGRWLDRMLDRLANLVVRRPKAMVGIAFAILAFSALGARSLRVDNSIRFWFAPSTTVRIDDALLNQRLEGTATLRILVEGREPNVLQQPAVLRAIDDLGSFLEAEPDIGGVTSLPGHVKRMHQAMNAGDPAYYRIPDDAAMIGEYLFLYGMSAGPNGLTAFVDAQYRQTMIRALSRSDTASFSRDLLERLQTFAAERFKGLPVEVGIAGGTLGIQTALNDVVVEEKMSNVLQISAVIFLLCSWLLRSFVGGLFVLTPLVVAVVFNLGMMGWTRTWLDMATATITAMGVSIGADFAIYLIFRIREEMARCGDLAEAIRTSLRTSGKAIFFVSSAVALGYLVLPLSGFSIWIRLGLLTSMIVAMSAVATLVLIPSLALLIRPRFLL
jgi:hypothetical protein